MKSICRHSSPLQALACTACSNLSNPSSETLKHYMSGFAMAMDGTPVLEEYIFFSLVSSEFVLLSNSMLRRTLMPDITDARIYSQSVITFSLMIRMVTPSPRQWRFNKLLLNDSDFIKYVEGEWTVLVGVNNLPGTLELEETK